MAAAHKQATVFPELATLTPAQLIALVVEKEERLKEKDKRIKLLEERLRLAKQQRYGASSEKLGFQCGLFDEVELEQALSDIEQQLTDSGEPPANKAPRKKGKGFSKKLPRTRVDLRLSAEEKAGASRTFFTKVKEELDIVPAKARVIEYWQEKAVFEDAEGEKLKAARRQPHPLGKCIASVQLLAYILVAKYADALPLYRLEKILARYGGNITRTTMANWIIRLEEVLKPLLNLMHEHQLSGDYLQADETRIQVLKEDGKAATSDKWMWLIRGGPPNQPVVLFHYDPSRSGEVISSLLGGYSGVLQTDGYCGYNRACRENAITRIGCWDHVRRKFVEANKGAPSARKHDKLSKAEEAIGKIGKLYAIEKRIEKLEPQQKTEQRQALARPVLEDLKGWLETNSRSVSKGSLTAAAITYAMNQWDYLIGYCDDGRLHISNALAENAIRPFAVGRRNWLFADTSRGAKASATAYSLIETAKANGLEPFEYLRHVLSHIAAADTVEKIEALLPWNINSDSVQQG